MMPLTLPLIKMHYNRTIYLLFAMVVLVTFSQCNSPESTQRQVNPEIEQRSFVFGENKPFPQCHASTLVRLDNGEFLVASFGGTEEKDDDVGIWLSRGDGETWSEAVEVAKIRNDAHWNPVLFQAPSGEVILYFKVGKTIPKWETWVITSNDHGHTWSEAYELVPGDQGGRGPVRNKPIILSDGTWLAGASHEEGQWDVFIDRSEDGGKTWNATPYLEVDRNDLTGKGIIQPTLWESAPGIVHMLIRSSAGAIYRSDSDDYGRTWSSAYRTDLPNPNTGIDLVKLADGTLALLYNPDDKNWGSRGTLLLAFSYDNGETWPDEIEIEKAGEDSEFSYPAIIQWEDRIALTYTWERSDLVFMTLAY